MAFPQNLMQLLRKAASMAPECGLSFYLPGDLSSVGKRTSYRDLLQQSEWDAKVVSELCGVHPEVIVLLHFDNHVDNIKWLWAVIAAGLLPAISTPMTSDLESRKRHLSHLRNVLDDPVILTSEALRSEFGSVDGLNIQTIDHLQPSGDHREGLREHHCSASVLYNSSNFIGAPLAGVTRGDIKHTGNVAILMLTSGSSGNAKAVCLRHEQIIHAVSSKSQYHDTTSEDIFLNWIGLDHVANLLEIHLYAMSVAADQFHVQASDLLAQPYAFFDLIDRHRVTQTFAPNFFLGSLRRKLALLEPSDLKRWDLSSLRICVSGGEANTIETVKILDGLLKTCGAAAGCIRPAFGMTETCAGSIYNCQCPQVDIESGRDFTSVGSCIPGQSMRIVLGDGKPAGPNEVGSLQLSGPIVFKEYRNNLTATKEAFTEHGWFITGDLGVLDEKGFLWLVGRSKETIIVNGVKYFPHELETAMEEAAIEGIVPSCTVVFSHRPKGSDTEVLVVLYCPAYQQNDIDARARTSDQISKISMMQAGVRPYAIIPLAGSLLAKTSLGKLSRAKLRTAFESGVYVSYQTANEKAIRTYRKLHIEAPSNEVQETILDCSADLLEISRDDIGISTSLFDWGVNSIETIKLKTLIQRRLKLQDKIPIITIMANPTIKALAAAVDRVQEAHLYDPIVTLQASGAKTPVFLFHPGVGEVLVFLNLAKHMTDRPVHAIRARGFDGEPCFNDIPEVVYTYYNAIKKIQPDGPYALAGYSYGAMLAFEVSKKLETNGDRVGFLASLNLPPHIKWRMRQLDFVEAMLNLSYFIGLLSDTYAHAISEKLHQLSYSEAADFIISKAPPERMNELALDKVKLQSWANVAYCMLAIARDYDPTGNVDSMDVFYAIPLSAVSNDMEDWLENFVGKWRNFVRSDVRFTLVDGAHYTMIGPDHVLSFSRKFRQALADRGL